MSPVVFRKAVGHFDGRRLRFGNESFDLAGIHDAIREIGENVAPRLRDLLEIWVPIQIPTPKTPARSR